MPIHASGRGDRLAAGDTSASFSVAPGLRFDEGVMRDDLKKLAPEQFILKYYITCIEYDRLVATQDEERINSFAEEMKQRAEIFNKQIEDDAKQEQSLNRECFLTPFVPTGITGRVIVSRDQPVKKNSPILLPKSLRKDKTLLPTTGHVIKESLEATDGFCLSLLGKRVLFSPMSGTAICFKGYPTWIQLELSEILAIVDREDASIVEEELEPLT